MPGRDMGSEGVAPYIPNLSTR